MGDTGKFVGNILAEPDRCRGTTFCVAQALYNMDELVAILSKATGKGIVLYISEEDFRKSLPFDGLLAGILVEAFTHQGVWALWPRCRGVDCLGCEECERQSL